MIRRKREQTMREIQVLQAAIAREVSFSALGGESAVSMRIVYKRSDLSSIKGVAMESMDGNLSEVMMSTLSFEDRMQVANRVCDLVADLHAKNILHLDIKLNNFLYKKTGSDFEIKICDFGVSKKIDENEFFSARIARLTPPETIQRPHQKQFFSPSMDAWALGVTLVDILYGAAVRCRIVGSDGVPHPAETVRSFLSEFEWGNPRVGLVIQGLLEYNPCARWSSHRAAMVCAQIRHT